MILEAPDAKLAIPGWEPVFVPVSGSPLLFPVRRIYCVGRNYLEHIREMGGDEREPPFFFQKPTDAIVHHRATIRYPSFTTDFQHEVELVLAVGRGGVNIAVQDAAAHVFGAAVGIDLTRRDVQVAARKAGRPWEVGKSFDHSAPCGNLMRLSANALPAAGRIELQVNDVVKQSGDLANMIWSAAEIISKLSDQNELVPGDLIFTGTPAGVGPIRAGDRLVATVEGLDALSIEVR